MSFYLLFRSPTFTVAGGTVDILDQEVKIVKSGKTWFLMDSYNISTHHPIITVSSLFFQPNACMIKFSVQVGFNFSMSGAKTVGESKVTFPHTHANRP